MRPSGGRSSSSSGDPGGDQPRATAPGQAGSPYQQSPSRDRQYTSQLAASAAAARGASGQGATSAQGGPPVPPMPSSIPGPAQGIRSTGISPGLERALQSFRTGSRPSAPGRQAAGVPGRRVVSDTAQGEAVPAGGGGISEDISKIKDIIEEAVEQQVAAALAPLRVVVNELNKVIQFAGEERADLREQNDTLGRQIDLHYRDIQEHSAMASNHIRSLATLIGSQSQANDAANENLAVACTLIAHLSQVVANLPQSLSQVVEIVVCQAIHSALGQVAAAEQEALDSIRTFLNSQFEGFEFRQHAAAQQQGVMSSQGGGRQEAQQDGEGSTTGFGKFKAMISKRPPKPGPE